MDLIWMILIAIAVIILLSMILRFLRRTIRFAVTGAVIVVLAGAGLYLYQDATDLRNNFASSEKLFLLDMGGKIVAGFTSRGVEAPFALNDVSRLNELYQNKNFRQMKERYYKLIIFKWPAFSSIPEVSDKEYVITREEAQKALMSPNARQLYVEKTVALKGEQYRQFIQNKAGEEFPSETNFKGIIFGLFVSEAGKENLMIPEFKKGNVVIYPEKLILRLVKIFPDSMLEKFLPVTTSYAGE